jgi:hypothetical protein
MRAWLIAMAVGAAALGLVVLPMQAAPNAGQRVSFSGCVVSGTPNACLMIKSPDGTIYNVNAITPRPRALDRVIRVRGTITDKASACDQGVVLDRIRWSRTRQHCPSG